MQILKYDQVDSTQDLAKQYLQKANPKLTAFVADSQIKAYGKRGRSFYSPANTGIYFSIAIPNFHLNRDKGSLLTPWIAVKLVKVLQAFFPEKDFRVKWVNDLYLNHKKIGGILTEAFANNLVIGVGINLSTTNFPVKIKAKAGSISLHAVKSEHLLASLLQAVVLATEDYLNENVIAEYRQLSCILNKQVSLQLGKQIISGKAVDIDDQGKLVVKTGQVLHHFSSGEIIKVNMC